jgi:hypothetical protein
MIKFLLCTIILLFSFLPIYGQIFSVEFADTIIIGNPSDELIANAVITNLTSEKIVININRESNDLPDNWSSSLCLTICLLPGFSSMTDSIEGNGALNFSIHFFTDAIPGEGQARLSFELEDGTERKEYLIQATTLSSDIENNNAYTSSYILYGNYPNPFNTSTLIKYRAPAGAHKALLYIYDLKGSLIYSREYAVTGSIHFHSKNLLGNSMASGIYFYRLNIIGANFNFYSAAGKFTYLR